MSNITTINHLIPSCYDFELGIERNNLLNFSYSYKQNIDLKGIVFIISGFGDDTDEKYLKHLREYTADKFDVVCVNVFYHCFYARPDNGALFYPDKQDTKIIKSYLDEHNITSENRDIYEALHELGDSIELHKQKGKINKNIKLIIPLTLFPLHNEYQNFGIMQALDHLNVLSYLQTSSLNFEKNHSTVLIGSSHGGYIAHLCAKLVPKNIDLVIDNSAYIKPPYSFIVGKEYNSSKPEFFDSTYHKNLILYFFTKTNWTLDASMPNFFSNDRYRIRDIGDEEHLQTAIKSCTKKTRYISYHSKSDLIAPFEEKKFFYDKLNSLGFNATLHIIETQEAVDGKFIKNLNHGMGMSLKELINRELPKIYELQSSSDKAIQPAIFDCDTLSYRFEFNGAVFCAHTLAIENENENDITQFIQNNFSQNIAYIEKNHSDLYQKLVALDSAVEQILYQNRYEIIHQNGSFEIIDTSINKNFYTVGSAKYASIASDEINFSRDSGVFETFKKITISDEDVAKYDKLTIYENNLSGHANILNYVQKEHSQIMNKIDKFIFFGVGLGSHIVSIDAKISAKIYLIVEDNLELFRLSLFTTPYYKIAKKSELIFSVFETKQEFVHKATYFLNHYFYLNHYIKYFHMLQHNEEKFVEFHLQIASQSHHLFFYNSILQQYLRPIEYIKEGFNFLNILKHYQSLMQKPVILLAAGPSLQKNIAWLKPHQKQFVIVALSAVLSILEKENITPDIITHLDGFDESDILFKRVQNLSFFDKSIFLIASRTPPNIVNILPKEHIFFFESGTAYKKDFGSLSAFCVGSTTYLLLIALGVSQLYLLGLDLALDGKTGKTHSDGHPLVQKLNLKTINQEKDTMIFNDNIIEVLGNFDEKVYTTSGFATSIASINATSGGFKKSSQQVYNLSDGARFTNTLPLSIKSNFADNLPLLEKQTINKEILQEFITNSSNKLSNTEYATINKRVSNAQKIKTEIENWQATEFKTSSSFLKSFTILMSMLYTTSSDDDYDLAFICQEYFKLIASHIFDFFNTATLTNTTRHSANLQKMLSQHLLNIVNLYINGLRK